MAAAVGKGATDPVGPVATGEAKPGVAVLLPAEGAAVQAAIDWEWTLQERVRLVDPARLAATVQDHLFALNARTTAADLVALAKYVDADYLLAVVPGEAGSTVRLVDVNAEKMEDGPGCAAEGGEGSIHCGRRAPARRFCQLSPAFGKFQALRPLITPRRCEVNIAAPKRPANSRAVEGSGTAVTERDAMAPELPTAKVCGWPPLGST